MSLRNWLSLRQRADFLRIQNHGQKWVTPAFVIQVLRRDDSTSSTEIGFTATKKLGGAVIRNRAKRRLRALCDSITPEFNLSGCQCVLIARSDALTKDFTELSRDMRWACRKLGLEGAAKAANHAEQSA